MTKQVLINEDEVRNSTLINRDTDKKQRRLQTKNISKEPYVIGDGMFDMTLKIHQNV